MVWGTSYAQGVSPLVKINENMNGAIYKDISENNLLSYAEKTLLQNLIF